MFDFVLVVVDGDGGFELTASVVLAVHVTDVSFEVGVGKGTRLDFLFLFPFLGGRGRFGFLFGWC